MDSLAAIHRRLSASPEDLLRTPAPPVRTPPAIWHEHRGQPRLALPARQPLAMPLGVALGRRRSAYEYAPRPLALGLLADLCGWTCGIGRRTPAYGRPDFPLGLSPSAGGLWSVNLYVVAHRVEGLAGGLYSYHPGDHCLIELHRGDLRESVRRCAMGQPQVADAPAALILSCSLGRGAWKYGVRHYRTVHLDAGVVTQSLYLVATALGMCGCAMSGFFDEPLRAFLGVRDDDEFPVLLFAAGEPVS
jgi:SagB-type dehydrogenase family enzyme